jgi:mRNA-degrading endonuclease toxin of MazEF toxin-antitoxin module
VVLCDLSPVVGTEQAGIRPALVVQIDRANTVSPHTIIVPFTTRIRRAVLSSHALIPAGIGGLTHDSVALCEQIRIIDNSGEDYLYPAHYFQPFDWGTFADEEKTRHTALTIHLDPHTKAILHAEALATHKSMGTLVRQWIEERLELQTE